MLDVWDEVVTVTDWHPPIETGLSGDRYVETAAEQLIAESDTLEEMSDTHAPAVYALRLSVPSDRTTVEIRWECAYDAHAPEWLWVAHESERVVYVGAAKSLFARLHQHAEGTRTASVCLIYPPHSIERVWWYDTAEEAFDNERQHADELAQEHPTWYVHQR
jgi:predicted GIY-YIG superfamily endonuclease